MACSGVPFAAIPATASDVPKMAIAIPASPQHISSRAIGIERPVGSEKLEKMKSVE